MVHGPFLTACWEQCFQSTYFKASYWHVDAKTLDKDLSSAASLQPTGTVTHGRLSASQGAQSSMRPEGPLAATPPHGSSSWQRQTSFAQQTEKLVFTSMQVHARDRTCQDVPRRPQHLSEKRRAAIWHRIGYRRRETLQAMGLKIAMLPPFG